ncbi:uncharacterized protein METZ01_LOCUS161026 [marine metagenome]|uniref:Uncharacterized protein n=1 Tax=marine metagenome TaxID=408172 RepID=A0A382B4E9_9ZZZZ
MNLNIHPFRKNRKQKQHLNSHSIPKLYAPDKRLTGT